MIEDQGAAEMNSRLSFLLIGIPQGYWYDILQESLASLGSIEVVTDDSAVKEVVANFYDLIIIDAAAVDEIPLPILIIALRRARPASKIIVMTASPIWTVAREVLKAGALDYVTKSLNQIDILSAVTKALESQVSPSIIKSI